MNPFAPGFEPKASHHSLSGSKTRDLVFLSQPNNFASPLLTFKISPLGTCTSTQFAEDCLDLRSSPSVLSIGRYVFEITTERLSGNPTTSDPASPIGASTSARLSPLSMSINSYPNNPPEGAFCDAKRCTNGSEYSCQLSGITLG